MFLKLFLKKNTKYNFARRTWRNTGEQPKTKGSKSDLYSPCLLYNLIQIFNHGGTEKTAEIIIQGTVFNYFLNAIIFFCALRTSVVKCFLYLVIINKYRLFDYLETSCEMPFKFLIDFQTVPYKLFLKLFLKKNTKYNFARRTWRNTGEQPKTKGSKSNLLYVFSVFLRVSVRDAFLN
jgi:hypothetical protein